MEYQVQAPYEKKFDYGSLGQYGKAKCGTGLKEPVFSVYAPGSTFLKNVKPIPMCGGQLNYNDKIVPDFPYKTSSEFGKMLRQKKM